MYIAQASISGDPMSLRIATHLSMAWYKNCAGMVRAIVERFIWAGMDPAAKKLPL
jgi:hypothetical protein